jgi:hypothetical protein
MGLGRWAEAIISAVFWVSLPGALYLCVNGGLPNTAEKLAQLGGLLLVYYAIYGFLSLVGWMVIGMPVHWLICKYAQGKAAWYWLAIVVFTAVACVIAGVALGAVMGGVALVEWWVFRYVAYRQTATST